MNRFTLIFVSAASLSAPQAFAAAYAIATLNNVSVTLTDLDPLDGIAPSITFLTESGPNGSYVRSELTDFAENGSLNEAWGETAFAPASISQVLPGRQRASAWVRGDGTLASTSLRAAGTATMTSEIYAEAQALGPFLGPFTLSANTQFSLSMTSTVSAVVNSGGPTLDVYGWFYAQNVVSIVGTGSDGTGEQWVNAKSVAYAESVPISDPAICPADGYCYGSDADSNSTQMSLSFTNLTSGDIAGELYMRSSVMGFNYAPYPVLAVTAPALVPEPGTYALVLAGLATVGVATRRRGR